MKRKLLFFTPLFIFFVLSAFLFKGLYSNPRELQTGRIGQPMPTFNLPDLMQQEKIWRNKDMLGEVYLLNVWGTWCPTCLVELPYLTKLRNSGIKIVGLYYVQNYDADFDPEFNVKALQTEVSQMMSRTGDPYQFNILDLNRTLSLDLGVSGAPETFLVDKNGVIVLHHTGDINERVWRAKFASKIQELM